MIFNHTHHLTEPRQPNKHSASRATARRRRPAWVSDRDAVVDTLSRRASGGIQVCSRHTTCTLHRQAARLSRAVRSCCSTQGRSSLHIAFTYMFFNVTRRTSDAIAHLQVSPILGVALVEFDNGYSYEYTNVSRRAIANLLMNPNMSLGFWVNQNCIRPERTACLTLV